MVTLIDFQNYLLKQEYFAISTTEVDFAYFDLFWLSKIATALVTNTVNIVLQVKKEGS